MARWAKLHDKVSESYDFAEAHRRDPNAALLFLLALPHADVYGVLPGHPRLLQGKLCGLLDLTDDQIAAAFVVLDDLGMVVCYHDSKGRPLVCVANYGAHQDVRWDRVAPPTHELPPCWTPPADLLTTAKVKPDCEIAAWLRQARGSGPGPLRDHSRLDTEEETEEEEETETDKGLAPIASARPVIADVQAELAIVRAQFPDPADLKQVDEFISMVRGHRAGGKLQTRAEKTFTVALLALRQESGMTSEAFSFGIAAAVQHDADNVNYAAKAARGYAPRGNGTNGGNGRGSPPIRLRIGTDEEWDEEERRRTANGPAAGTR